ncbi:MAG: hypothetical protein ABSE41_17310 [Bacteroidota bacterium]|jgi:hypothetical protein
MVPYRTFLTAPRSGLLEAQVRSADQLRQVHKADLHSGDWVIVKSLQSTYRIRVKEDGRYVISGGWFDKKGLPPTELGIAGCTWGGSAIKTDIVAACGLCLEFANRLITSPIQKIILFRLRDVQ